MAGYQFLHVEGYASVSKTARSRSGQPIKGRRRWSTAEILDEATREKHACTHIASPQPPTWLHGSRAEVERAGADWLANTTVGKRKARSDAPWLLAGVLSLPRSNAHEWPDFAVQATTWLRQRYGDRLRGIVQHLDEAHPHIHFYAVPRPGESFATVHEGYAAKDAARRRGDRHTGRAYVEAMRQVQTDFQEQFAWQFGLARTGPGRERLTREKWRSVQAQAEADAAEQRRDQAQTEAGQAEQRAQEVVRSAATTRRVVLDRAAADVKAVKAEVEALREQVQQAEAQLRQSRSKAATRFKAVRGRLRDDRRVLRELRRELEQREGELTRREGELTRRERELASRVQVVRRREIEIQALAAAMTPDQQREAANRLPGELARLQATQAPAKASAPAAGPSKPVQRPPQKPR